ncbi:MAG: anti-sigma factor domain-containing protein [Carboxydocellales bacterium]
MGAQKGIITKITPTKCIIITKEGEFRSIPLPSGAVRIGQEIVVPSFKWPVLTKYALIAASLLIAVMGGAAMFQLTASAAPVAYVSLDINPSLEIAVDKAAQVVGVTALNSDSQPLIADLDYRDKDIYTVLTKLLQRAVDLKYVTPDRANLIVSSVVEVDPQHVNLDTTRLQAAVVTPLKGKTIKANMVIYKAKNQDRAAAKKARLSTGKYLFYAGEVENGSKITVDEVRQQSIATLVATKQARLPRPKQEILIQSLNPDDEIELVDDLNNDNTGLSVLTAPYNEGKDNNNQGGHGKSELGKHKTGASQENQTEDKQKPENIHQTNSKNAANGNVQDAEKKGTKDTEIDIDEENKRKAKDNSQQIKPSVKFKQDKQDKTDIRHKKDLKVNKDNKDDKENQDSKVNKGKNLRQQDVKQE